MNNFFLFRQKKKPDLMNSGPYLSKTAGIDKLNSDDVIITNIRHYEALLHVSESLGRVL